MVLWDKVTRVEFLRGLDWRFVGLGLGLRDLIFGLSKLDHAFGIEMLSP